jgi:hypothetical protein
MEYELTQHASEVICEREIQLSWIEATLENPDFIENDLFDSKLEHRFKRVIEFGNRVLRVVVNNNVNPIRIVTVYFDRTKNRKI